MPPTTPSLTHPAAAAAASGSGEEHVLIARQPIFEARTQQVFGYELLFRSSDENKYTATDGRFASSQTINRAIHSIGLDVVVGDKKAFINITRDLLLEEVYTLLPPDRCVVEILEDLTLDEEVIAACKKLRAAGYGLALDDVTSSERVKPLWGVADIVKVDLSLIAKDQRARVLRELAPYASRLLAEKVETKEEFDEAVALGCQYVQGYFFCRPELMRGRGLTGAEVIYLQFLRELNKPTLDYVVLEQIIKQDTSLAFKLLKYLNSAAVGLRNKVTSIQQALVMMGERPLRKWGSLVVITSINSKRPPELMLTSLVRAHFCEAVARKLNLADQQLEMFLVGLLSSMDVVLGMPMAQIVEQTGVSETVRSLLLQESAAPKDLNKIFALSVACERGAWSTVSKTSTGLRLTQGDIATIYYGALGWANQALAAAAA